MNAQVKNNVRQMNALESRCTSGYILKSQHARELHVLDIENMLGSGRFSENDVSNLAASYSRSVRPSEDAHIIAAASSEDGAAAIGFGWPGLRLCWKPGRNGADECLVEVLESEHVASRFDHVYIASGDWIFTDSAIAIAKAGCRVTVVSGRGKLSTGLTHSCSDIRSLQLMELDELATAA